MPRTTQRLSGDTTETDYPASSGAGLSAYFDWQSGHMSPVQALYALCSDLGELEDQLKPAQQERELLRNQISEILAHHGETLTIPGFGVIEITRPSVSKGYDKKQLDELVIELTGSDDETQHWLAQRIVQCRTQSERAGSLRIIREKAK